MDVWQQKVPLHVTTCIHPARSFILYPSMYSMYLYLLSSSVFIQILWFLSKSIAGPQSQLITNTPPARSATAATPRRRTPLVSPHLSLFDLIVPPVLGLETAIPFSAPGSDREMHPQRSPGVVLREALGSVLLCAQASEWHGPVANMRRSALLRRTVI